MTTVADLSSIPLESTRRERRYRETQVALAHANRVATMGELTASIAHEVKQPLAAAAADAKACLNWLTRNTPEIEEAKECAECLLKQIDRAVEITDRIHQFVKKTGPRKRRLDVNETIVEVIELIQGEILRNGVAVRTELADCLPPIQGDRVQLQQVILNLIVNAIEAMRHVSDGTRELAVTTGAVQSGEVVHVAVRDSGPGPSVANLERLFQPFYTTKPTAWAWVYQSAGRSSKITADACGQARTYPAGRCFNSPCRRSQTLRRDAALVSRPKELGN